MLYSCNRKLMIKKKIHVPLESVPNLRTLIHMVYDQDLPFVTSLQDYRLSGPRSIQKFSPGNTRSNRLNRQAQ